MSPDLEIVKTEYQAGKIAFERGQYREAVERLEKACALVNRNSRLGGEVQLWLATAYEALGQVSKAIALCEQLKHHPDSETSKQGKRLLYILQAPQLKRPTEWLTQIPDMGQITDNNSHRLGGGTVTSNRSSALPPQLEPVDLSQVNTKDNRFIWVCLVAIALVLAGLWLS